MIPAANRYTVVLDASVLFPNMKRDILLRFFEADLYRARWSEMIQQEWLTRAKQKFPDKAAASDRTDALMRQHFEDAWVERVERWEFIAAPSSNGRDPCGVAAVTSPAGDQVRAVSASRCLGRAHRARR